MAFSRVSWLAPPILGSAFFAVYCASWLIGIPIPTRLADGLILGICGCALLIGYLNARTGGRLSLTLAQPFAIFSGYVVAEFIRDVGPQMRVVGGPYPQTYAIGLLLSVVLGGLAYLVGNRLEGPATHQE